MQQKYEEALCLAVAGIALQQIADLLQQGVGLISFHPENRQWQAQLSTIEYGVRNAQGYETTPNGLSWAIRKLALPLGVASAIETGEFSGTCGYTFGAHKAQTLYSLLQLYSQGVIPGGEFVRVVIAQLD